jgi:putative ABC transport system permease protein
MLRMSWSTFRDRAQIFVGAVITVCLGVAMVQSSLLTLVSVATVKIPPELPAAEATALRDAKEGALALLGNMMGVAAFVAVFIVSSTFAFAVAQRRRDLALLRLTGAGRGQMRRLLLGEALLLGTVGSALGVLLGVPVMRLLAKLLDEFGFVPPGFEAQWRLWVVPASLGTGLGIAVFGVLAASRRAARLLPLEALRETGQAARVMTGSRWVLGGLFLAGGCTMLVLMAAVGGEAALALSIMVSMLLVIAFAALAPLMVPLVSWPLGLFARGHLGQLAYANLRSGVRRSAATAAPVMMLVAFVAGTAATMATIGEASRQEVARTLRGDLVVSSEGAAGSELAGMEGVRTVSEEVPLWFDVEVDEVDGELSYELEDGLAVDPAAYAETHRLDVSAGDLADLRGEAVAVVPSAVDGREQIGDPLRVRIDGQLRELRIVALLPDTLAGPFFLLPHEFAADDPGPRQYVIGLAPGTDAAPVADRLAGSGFGEVRTAEQWVRRYADEQQQTSIDIMVVLLGMATVYTVIAIVNAVVISASDRRSEFAVARVTGLTRGQVVRVALLEALAVVAIGLLLGGIAAAATALGVSAAVKDLIGLSALTVPWSVLAGVVLGITAIVGVTTFLTTRSATRTPAIRLSAADG